MRSIVIPGARRETMVASTVAASAIDPAAASITPAIQKSAPVPGESAAPDSGT